MKLQFPHRIKYEADARTVDDIIETLVAQKRLITEGAIVLCALIGTDYQNIEIKVTEIKSGSLLEEFVIRLYTTYQTDIESKVTPIVEKLVGADIPPEAEALVTLLAIAVTYLVARFAYDAIAGKKDRGPSTHLDGDYNIVVNNISSKLDISEECVRATLDKNLPRAKKRALVRDVTWFLNLARRNRGSKITVDGFGDIGPDTIAEYPSDADLLEIDDRHNIDVPDVKLAIRATDRDRSKTGWAAIIVGDSRFKKRLPMYLYPTVDAVTLANQETVRADVVLEGETTETGMFKAKRIHILRFWLEGDDNPKEST